MDEPTAAVLVTKLWRCRDGRFLRIREMEDEHIQRCIALILARNDGWRANWMPTLLAELEKRKKGERPW